MDHTKFEERKEEAIKEELSAQLGTLNIEGNEENDEQVSSDQLENTFNSEVKKEDTEQVPSDQSTENELFELAKKICDKLKLNTEMQEDGSRSIAASIQLLKSAHDSIQKEEDMKNNKKNQKARCQGVSPKTLYEEANENMRVLYIQLDGGEYSKDERYKLRTATHNPLKDIGWKSEHKTISYLYYKNMEEGESDESLREGVQQVLNTLLNESLRKKTNLSSLLIKAIPKEDFSFFILKPALIPNQEDNVKQPMTEYVDGNLTCTLHLRLSKEQKLPTEALVNDLKAKRWISRFGLKTVYSKQFADNERNTFIWHQVDTLMNNGKFIYNLMKPKYESEVEDGKKTLDTFEEIWPE